MRPINRVILTALTALLSLAAAKAAKPSGTLPILHVNVYDENGQFDNEIISRDLAHKNYFDAEYWLDVNGCQWLIDLGAESVGSEEKPLPLEIKARGNWTRTGYAKKPFKLKLGKKQSLLGLTKSKHFAILAHADDQFGYLRNFVGFNLGQRIGLPWTPAQQPLEVVINGDYRGVYFLTESIRVGDDRVMIEELDDNALDRSTVTGGYIVELDNYWSDKNQIHIKEKYASGVHSTDWTLLVTFDTPEEYSDLQRRFIEQQFTAMNDLVGANSDDLWSYLDLDDAVRYYIVEELISHTEAFHGSTYIFRDRGADRKWHFSPLWDQGHAFDGATDKWVYDNSLFGMSWVGSWRVNKTFNDQLAKTWNWFMSTNFATIYDDIREYCDHIAEAAKADRERWKNEPAPAGGAPVQDNSDIDRKRDIVIKHLGDKAIWLRNRLGDFASGGPYPEPERDNRPAASLPYFAIDGQRWTVTLVDDTDTPWQEVSAFVWGPDPQQSGNFNPLGPWPGTPAQPTTVDGLPAWTITFDPAYDLTASARIIFNDTNSGQGHQTADLKLLNNAVYYRSGRVEQSAIGQITADNDATRYFNLQGIEIANPQQGAVYIRLTGGKADKIIY